jgi:hypothetical protein
LAFRTRAFIGYLSAYWEDSAAFQPDLRDHHRWVRHQDAWWIGIQRNDGAYHLLNPETGDWLLLDEPPMLQLADPPAGAVQLRFRIADGRYFWDVLPANADAIPLGDGEAFSPFAPAPVIAPDGQRVVYVDGTTLALWHEGEARVLPTPEDTIWEHIYGLAWGPLVWQTSGSAGIPLSPTPYPEPTVSRG